MIDFTSISPVVVQPQNISAYSRSPSGMAQSLFDDRFTSIQRRELGKVLNNLDKLEDSLNSSGLRRKQTLVEPISANAFVQSGLLAVRPDDAINQGPSNNLVVNGSFEENVVSGTHAKLQDVNAWSNTSGKIEVWRSLTASADAEQNVELDVDSPFDTLEQTVTTIPGQIYEISFAFAPTPKQNKASNSFEVLFDGIVLDTIGARGGSFAAPNWNVYSYTVEATSTDSEIVFRETSSNGRGVLLDAVSLKESTNAVGSSSVSDLAIDTFGTLLSDQSIESGSIIINGQSIDIDVGDQSLQDIVSTINSTAIGVTASLVSTRTVSPQNIELYRLELTSASGGFSLADNGTNFFGALGWQDGAYGEVYEVNAHAGSKARGYRAADALESINESLKALFENTATVGSASLQSALTSMFDGLADRYTESQLTAIGLNIADVKDGFLDISQQSRRRFSKAVYQNNNLVENLLLKSYDRNENGLIEVLRETIKAQLKADGGSIGNIINKFA